MTRGRSLLLLVGLCLLVPFTRAIAVGSGSGSGDDDGSSSTTTTTVATTTTTSTTGDPSTSTTSVTTTTTTTTEEPTTSTTSTSSSSAATTTTTSSSTTTTTGAPTTVTTASSTFTGTTTTETTATTTTTTTTTTGEPSTSADDDEIDLKTAFDDPATAQIVHAITKQQSIDKVLTKLQLTYKSAQSFLDSIAKSAGDSEKVQGFIAAWQKAQEDVQKFEAIATNFYNGFVNTIAVRSSTAAGFDTPRKFSNFLTRSSSASTTKAVAVTACLAAACADVSTAQTKTAGCKRAKQRMGLALDDNTVLCSYTCAQALETCKDAGAAAAVRERRAGAELSATLAFTIIGAELDVAAIKKSLASTTGVDATFNVTSVSSGKSVVTMDAAGVEIELDLSELEAYDQNSTEALASYLSAAITVGLMSIIEEVTALLESSSVPSGSTGSGAKKNNKAGGLSKGGVAAVVIVVLLLLFVLILILWLKKKKERTGGSKVSAMDDSGTTNASPSYGTQPQDSDPHRADDIASIIRPT